MNLKKQFKPTRFGPEPTRAAANLSATWVSITPIWGSTKKEWQQAWKISASTRGAQPPTPTSSHCMPLWIALTTRKRHYEQAVAHKVNNPFIHGNRYGVAFLDNDSSEMQRQVADASGKPGEDVLFSFASDTEAFHGRLAMARDLSKRAIDSALGTTIHRKQQRHGRWMLPYAMPSFTMLPSPGGRSSPRSLPRPRET